MQRDSKLTGILGIVCVKIAQVCVIIEIACNIMFNDNLNKVVLVAFGILFVALFDVVEAMWIKELCNTKNKNNHEKK